MTATQFENLTAIGQSGENKDGEYKLATKYLRMEMAKGRSACAINRSERSGALTERFGEVVVGARWLARWTLWQRGLIKRGASIAFALGMFGATIGLPANPAAAADGLLKAQAVTDGWTLACLSAVDVERWFNLASAQKFDLAGQLDCLVIPPDGDVTKMSAIGDLWEIVWDMGDDQIVLWARCSQVSEDGIYGC